MSGFLGAGDIYFDRLDDAGNATGLVMLGDSKQFAINEPSEDKTRTSQGYADYVQMKDAEKLE